MNYKESVSCEERNVPSREFVERRAAVFAEKSMLMESDGKTSVARRSVAYCLLGHRVLDDAIGGTTVRTEPLFRHRKIKDNQVIVPKGFFLLTVVFSGSFVKKLYVFMAILTPF